MTNSSTLTGAYVRGEADYRALGWPGVLPVDVPGIGMPPTGYTGGKNKPNWNVYPDDAQYQAWRTSHVDANLGLRVPDDVLVIDLDCYNDKGGCQTLEFYELNLGNELPTSWYSTSRQDGSRKIFFRVPRYGVRAWKEPGEGMELLHHGHRWVRVWPSLNPKTSGPERWYTPEGKLSDTPPRPDQLTELPPHWIEALSQRRKRTPTAPGGATDLDLGARETDGEKFDWQRWYNAEVITSLDCSEAGYSGQDGLLASAAMSLRATATRDVHAIKALCDLVDKFENDPSNEKGDWTHEQAVDKWRKVVENHPGGSGVGIEIEDWMLDFARSSAGMAPDDPAVELFDAAITKGVADRVLRKATDIAYGKYEQAQRGESWLDVAAALAEGLDHPEPPSVLPFADGSGRALLYPGVYNTLFGAGGTGKSLLLATLQAEHINRGEHVVHLEYDNNPFKAVLSRLVRAGARPEMLSEYFHVLVNEQDIPSLDFTPSLMTLDSVNPAMALYGIDTNSSSRAVDMLIQRLVEPFTSLGATVLSLDHVGHTETHRPSNNVRKIQAVQGIMLLIERFGEQAGGVGTRWHSTLTVKKDNPGWAPVAVDERLGFVEYDGRAGDGTFRARLLELPLDGLHEEVQAREQAARDASLQGRIMRVMEGTVIEPISKPKLLAELNDDGGSEVKDSTLRLALQGLETQGSIRVIRPRKNDGSVNATGRAVYQIVRPETA